MLMCGSQSWLQAAFQAARRAGKPACTVESLALPVHPVCDAAASSRIKETAGELYLGEAFIPFHGPKAHADRQDCPPHGARKLVLASSWQFHLSQIRYRFNA